MSNLQVVRTQILTIWRNRSAGAASADNGTRLNWSASDKPPLAPETAALARDMRRATAMLERRLSLRIFGDGGELSSAENTEKKSRGFLTI